MNMADRREIILDKYRTRNYYPRGNAVRTDFETFSDTFDDLDPNVCFAVDHHLSYQIPHNKGPEAKKSSGSKASVPITILDDESDAAEISLIDLETDSEASNDGLCTAPVNQADGKTQDPDSARQTNGVPQHVEDDSEASHEGQYTAPMKQAVAGAHDSGFQETEAGSHSSCSNTQEPDPATYANRVPPPLFRVLTKDDLPASGVQSTSEDRGVGFKAWYRAVDTNLTDNTAPARQQNESSQFPSIAVINGDPSKNTARRDRDAPQYAMNVLKSKRKRTINELGYDELISPAQIESPSEKLARVAKKRRQRLNMCGLGSQSTKIGDAQLPINFGQMDSHENDKTTREKDEIAVSSIVYGPLNRRETMPRLDDAHSRSSVDRSPSPVSAYMSNEGQKDHQTIQSRKDQSDGLTGESGISSIETIAQEQDAQQHGSPIDVASSNGSANRKHKRNLPRKSGPTNACGVFSPEKKPPVKKSDRGAFHCPRCDSQFTTSQAVNYHFEKCIAKYGNPRSLKWNDHPSLLGVGNRGKRVVSTNRNEETITVPTRVSTAPEAIDDTVAPSARSSIQVSGVSNLPEERPMTEGRTSDSNNEPRLDHEMLNLEHRATGGKGLSAETLKTFQETGSWDQSADEAQDEETEVPDVAYFYFVQKREWFETENDAIESSMGPYHSLNEANAVAKTEVQCPQIDEFEGIQSKGWSYYYRQDEYGMQMHKATVLGVNIETVVYRGTWQFFRVYSPAKTADSGRL